MIKLIFVFFLITTVAVAQENILEELETKDNPETDVTLATFKGTRIINGHSIETTPGNTLEFIFAHRFGRLNSGWYDMFGLDQAMVRIGLDYGITDKLSVSVGRSSTDKTLDSYVKYKLLQQKKGATKFPLTITALGGVAYKFSPKKNTDVSPVYKNADRLSYTAQILVARKMNSNLSLQIMPSLIQKNYAMSTIEESTQFALGVGGRYKITGSLAITSEYYHNMNLKNDSPYYNAFGIGLDIETGGHVFQLVFTNAAGLTERAFIAETLDNFFEGDIHFGFNVTRNFQFKNR